MKSKTSKYSLELTLSESEEYFNCEYSYYINSKLTPYFGTFLTHREAANPKLESVMSV